AAEARGLVAGQRFQLVAHPQRVAVVEGDALLHRNLDLAALLAAGRRPGDHAHRAGPGRHVHPGATGGEQEGGSGNRHQAHGQVSISVAVGAAMAASCWKARCHGSSHNASSYLTGLPSASITVTLPRPMSRIGCSIFDRSPTTTQVIAPGASVAAAAFTCAGVSARTCALRCSTQSSGRS